MKEKQPLNERRNRLDRLSNGLFGRPEEIDRTEAEDLLRSAGQDLDTLASDLYARLYKQAQEYWMAKKPLPPLLKSAIDELRPLTAPPRNEKDLASQAQAKIERTVEDARTFPTWTRLEAQEFRPSAYRNKGELSEKDKEELDEITKRLNEKLRALRGHGL